MADDYSVSSLGEQLLSSDPVLVADAAGKLAELELDKDKAAGLRLSGLVPQLVKLSGATDTDDALRKSCLIIAGNMAREDKSCKTVLVKEGIVRSVARILELMLGEDIVLAALTAVLMCFRDLDVNTRKGAIQEMFRLGTVHKMTNYLSTDADIGLKEVVARICGWITALTVFRERMRDLGIISPLLVLTQANPDIVFYSISLMNLSESESLHISLKESTLLSVFQEVINATSKEVVRTVALITLAHIYGGDADQKQAQDVLASHDVSRGVVQALDSVMHGDGWYSGLVWTVGELLKAVTSLGRNLFHAERLVKAGVLDLMIELLQPEQQDKGIIEQCCRALFSLTTAGTAIHSKLLQAGVVDVLQIHAKSDAAGVADAAKGCLLNLGLLQDAMAVHASDINTTANADDEQVTLQFDAFLSHKRTDAKDFARALYNLLVLRGISTFLDFEYREELKNLSSIVRNCANFIFILTDNIFDSQWCMKELNSAVENNCNIILVVKEGSRWKDAAGNKTLEFPPDEVLAALPESVRKIFTRKALYHSDEYYQAFVDQLLKKIVKSGSTPNPTPPMMSAEASHASMASSTDQQVIASASSTTSASAGTLGLQQLHADLLQLRTQMLADRVQTLQTVSELQSRQERSESDLSLFQADLRQELREVRADIRQLSDNVNLLVDLVKNSFDALLYHPNQESHIQLVSASNYSYGPPLRMPGPAGYSRLPLPANAPRNRPPGSPQLLESTPVALRRNSLSDPGLPSIDPSLLSKPSAASRRASLELPRISEEGLAEAQDTPTLLRPLMRANGNHAMMSAAANQLLAGRGQPPPSTASSDGSSTAADSVIATENGVPINRDTQLPALGLKIHTHMVAKPLNRPNTSASPLSRRRLGGSSVTRAQATAMPKVIPQRNTNTA